MKILFVLGMHRSGTSYLSGELISAGMRSPDNLLVEDMFNPKGYFESRELIAINERMLGHLGSNWMDPSSFPEDWQARLLGAGFDRPIQEFLSATESDERYIVLKDPRMSRLLPFWLSMIEAMGGNADIRAVLIFRSCLSVAGSLLRRNNIPIGHAFQLWARYNMDALSAIVKLPHAIVKFEEILSDPGLLRNAIEGLVGQMTGLANIGGFADKSLDHSSENVSLPADFNLPLMGDTSTLLLHNLQSLYVSAGGESVATERRHYAVIHSTLWTVIDEMRDLERRYEDLKARENISEISG